MYTKLFSSIISSTIWQEPKHIKVVWVTMLALCDANGEVQASVPGLAHIAGVTLEECEEALAKFQAPDRYSRTKDHDGRRIEEIPGGWVLLNHGSYRKIRSDEDRREQNRLAQARFRDKQKSNQDSKQSKQNKPRSAHTDTDTEAKSKSLVQQAARFDEFWAEYPSRPGTSKTNKKGARTKWLARKLDAVADQILEDIRLRKKSDKRWLDGFIPDPVTYLNQDRWLDDKPKSAAAVQAPKPGITSPMLDPEVARRQEREHAEKMRRDLEELERSR